MDQTEEIIVNGEPPPRSSRFLFQESDQIVNVGDQLKYEISFKDAAGKPIRDTNVNIKILPLQLPPTFYGLMKYEISMVFQMKNFITISPSSTRTNSNGNAVVYIRILPNFFGKWGLCFFAGSICSTPIFIKALNIATAVNIIQEPSFQGEDFPVGERLPIQPIIKVTALNGIPIPNAVVAAVFVPSGANKITGLIDVLSSDINTITNYETYLTITPEGYRFQRTDQNGIASFTNFGLLDVDSSACYSFKFIVGEPGLLIESGPTKQLCFYNDYSFRISGILSQTIGDNQPFADYPIIEITKNQTKNNSILGVFILAAFLTDIDSNAVTNPSVYSQSFLRGYVCLYING